MITRRNVVGTIAAGLATPWATRARSQASKELKLYNWFDYIPQSLLDKFAAETGIVVTVDTYDSNENLLARLKSGVTGYDLAVPSDSSGTS
jgi:spermidine/putrescine transport system substrate-binding protein